MTGDPSDLYAVLGITSQATQREIRRAYRTLMRRNHPDTRYLGDPSDNAASNITLQQALAAYAVLGDPARRAGYDQRTTPRQDNRSTSHPTNTPIRVRTVLHFPTRLPDQSPIQAGPVRWHHTR
jgi:DnaJ-class molecular chaperone